MLEAVDGDRGTMLDLAEVEQESRDTTRDLEQLWRRAVLACCINNTDTHLRNHGFLRRGASPGPSGSGGWGPRPCLDFTPTPFVGDFGTDVVDVGDGGDLQAVRAAAAFFRVSPARADEVVRQVQQAVRTWPQVASHAGSSAVEQRRDGHRVRGRRAGAVA